MARRNFDNLKGKVLERPGAPERIDAYKTEMDRELTLAELRKAREFTQTRLADALKIKQSGVSRIEHEADLYISTLCSYVEALGGTLELRAQFPGAGATTVNLADFEREPEQA